MALFFCVALYENFAVDQKASIFGGYVVKEFAHAFSCQPYQEGRVALGITLTHPSGSPNFPCASITQYTYAKQTLSMNKFSIVRHAQQNQNPVSLSIITRSRVYALSIICEVCIWTSEACGRVHLATYFLLLEIIAVFRP